MTAARFDPNTPPIADEPIAAEVSDDHDDNLLSADAVQRGNALAMTEAAQREANLIIGTTHAAATRADVRLSEDRRQAERQRAERTAARGGPSISTELRGDPGRAVSELLRLEDLARQASAIEHRISAEVGELEAAKAKAAEDALLDELLSEGWDASGAKRAVPAILTPFMHHAEHRKPVGRPIGFADEVRTRLRRQHATRNHQRVLDSLESVGKLLESCTLSILDSAGHAADVLGAAGLNPDASADDVLDAEDPAATAAWREWRTTVSEWSDVQSVRRWLAVALSSGFDPKRPAELLNDTDAERVSWQEQFVGAEVGVHTEGSHMALTWWLAHGRPAPAGMTAQSDVEAAR